MRASILVDSVLGLAFGIMVSAALIPIAGNSFQVMVEGVDASQMQSSVMRLRSDALGSASNANAVFIPAKDVFGNTNTIAFGSPGSNGNVTIGSSSAHEFDTLAWPLGSVSSEAFYYSAMTGLVRYRYLYRRPADGVAMCTATTACTPSNIEIVREYPGCSVFDTAYFTVPNLPAIDPMAADFAKAYPRDLKDVVVQTGYSSDVISGNRLVVYNVTCSAGGATIPEQVQLTAGSPLNTGKEPVTYTPPPIGGMSIAAAPNPVILGYGGADGHPSSGTIDASVTNYHHDFTLNGTTVGLDASRSVACGSISTLSLSNEVSSVSGSANSPPTSFPGMWMQFSAAANAVGSCTATFSTLSGLQPPDNVVKSASISIVVEGQLSVSPASMTFASPTAPAQSLSVSEPGYTGPFAISSNTCTQAGTTYASISGGGSGPNATFGVTPENGTAGLSGGTCAISFTDSVNSPPATVVITVLAQPESWPPAIVFAAPSTTITAYVPVTPRILVARLLNSALGGSVALAASNCSAVPYNVDGSGSPTTALPAYTVDPYNSAYSVPSSGCWDSGDFIVTEGGYYGSFSDGAGSCTNYVTGGSWSPTSATGPTALQVFTPGTSAVPSCSVVFQDASARSATSYAAVRFPKPMYAAVYQTLTQETWDCASVNTRGQCVNGGFQGSTSYNSAIFESSNQGASWVQVPSAPITPQFTDNESTCTTDVHAGRGGCTSGTPFGYSKSTWSPYSPPNAPTL